MNRGALLPVVLVTALLVTAGLWRLAPAPSDPEVRTDATDVAAPERPAADGLPPEAVETLRLIATDGPFPYDRDGATFQNREGRLPERPRGYYREYTVRTPGEGDRGARRIVTGGDPPTDFYYTDDHYRSFRRLDGGGAR